MNVWKLTYKYYVKHYQPGTIMIETIVQCEYEPDAVYLAQQALNAKGVVGHFVGLSTQHLLAIQTSPDIIGVDVEVQQLRVEQAEEILKGRVMRYSGQVVPQGHQFDLK